MNTPMTIKKLISAVTICVLFLGNSFPAVAQQTENLQWVPMTLVAFNAPGMDDVPPVRQSIIDLARVIWNREIESTPLNQTVQNNGRLPSFVLLSNILRNGEQYTFSILNSANARGCSVAENSKDAVDVYVRCPLRVTLTDGSSKNITRDYPNYCYIFPENQNNIASLNQAQFAYNTVSSTAYFRIIQHGKHIKACDKKIKIS